MSLLKMQSWEKLAAQAAEQAVLLNGTDWKYKYLGPIPVFTNVFWSCSTIQTIYLGNDFVDFARGMLFFFLR